jgi:hypothetical protein
LHSQLLLRIMDSIQVPLQAYEKLYNNKNDWKELKVHFKKNDDTNFRFTVLINNGLLFTGIIPKALETFNCQMMLHTKRCKNINKTTAYLVEYCGARKVCKFQSKNNRPEDEGFTTEVILCLPEKLDDIQNFGFVKRFKSKLVLTSYFDEYKNGGIDVFQN